MKLNNRGYMLVEVIISFTLAIIILFFMTNATISLKNKADDLYVETKLEADQLAMTRVIMNDINSMELTKVEKKEDNKKFDLTFKKSDGITVTTVTKRVSYEGNTFMYGVWNGTKYDEQTLFTKKLDDRLKTDTPEISNKCLKDGGSGFTAVGCTGNEKNKKLSIKIPGYTAYSNNDYGVFIDVDYTNNDIVVLSNYKATFKIGTGVKYIGGGTKDIVISSKADGTVTTPTITPESGASNPGWYTSPLGNIRVGGPNQQIKISGDVTFYARATGKGIIYLLNNGTVSYADLSKLSDLSQYDGFAPKNPLKFQKLTEELSSIDPYNTEIEVYGDKIYITNKNAVLYTADLNKYQAGSSLKWEKFLDPARSYSREGSAQLEFEINNKKLYMALNKDLYYVNLDNNSTHTWKKVDVPDIIPGPYYNPILTLRFFGSRIVVNKFIYNIVDNNNNIKLERFKVKTNKGTYKIPTITDTTGIGYDGILSKGMSDRGYYLSNNNSYGERTNINYRNFHIGYYNFGSNLACIDFEDHHENCVMESGSYPVSCAYSWCGKCTGEYGVGTKEHPITYIHDSREKTSHYGSDNGYCPPFIPSYFDEANKNSKANPADAFYGTGSVILGSGLKFFEPLRSAGTFYKSTLYAVFGGNFWVIQLNESEFNKFSIKRISNQVYANNKNNPTSVMDSEIAD